MSMTQQNLILKTMTHWQAVRNAECQNIGSIDWPKVAKCDRMIAFWLGELRK